MLSSSVSCTKTFKRGEGTHCGGCSQCIDRRFAAFAAGVDKFDEGIYGLDFVRSEVTDPEVKTTLVDYLRQASEFARQGTAEFYTTRANDLVDVVSNMRGLSEQEVVTQLHGLCRRHGTQVLQGLDAMRSVSANAGCGQKLKTVVGLASGILDTIQSPATAIKEEPFELFFSYSHKDEKLRDKLEAHLFGLRRQGTITGWHDRRITAGSEWEGEIGEHLEAARVILLLISANFLASKYCNDVEVTRAIERHKRREARVIPVILRDCLWGGEPFGPLQALPKDGKPIASRFWRNQDEAFTDVARGIMEAVRSMKLGESK